jgi:hypothetical protein
VTAGSEKGESVMNREQDRANTFDVPGENYKEELSI